MLIEVLGWIIWAVVALCAWSLTYGFYVGITQGVDTAPATKSTAAICWLLLVWTLLYPGMNKLHILWLAPLAFFVSMWLFIARGFRFVTALIVLSGAYLFWLNWLTPAGTSVSKVTLALVIVVGIGTTFAFLHAMGTPAATEKIHRQTVDAVLHLIALKRVAAPRKPLPEIYLSIAQERNTFLIGIKKEDYLEALANAGCFAAASVIAPEVFAETVAHVEDIFKFQRAGLIR